MQAVMFHHFCDGIKHPRGQGAIDAEQFSRLLDAMDGRNLLRAEEWLSKQQSGNLTEKDTCLTFDDNLLCQYEVALPILSERGLTGFWFVYTMFFDEGDIPRLEVYRYFRTTRFENIEDFYLAFFDMIRSGCLAERADAWLAGFSSADCPQYPPHYSLNDRRFRQMRDNFLTRDHYFQIMDEMIDRYGGGLSEIGGRLLMSPQQLKTLSDNGHIIGLHSHTHPTALDQLPYDLQRLEYETNASRLSAALGRQPITMSHPCNSYASGTLEILRDLGIVLGFRADTQQAQYSSLEFPREDHVLTMARYGLCA